MIHFLSICTMMILSQCVSRGGAECGRHLVLMKTFYKNLKLCQEVIYIRCTQSHTLTLTQLINLQTSSCDISSPLNRPSFTRQCSLPQSLPWQDSLPQFLPWWDDALSPSAFASTRLSPLAFALTRKSPWLKLQGINAIKSLYLIITFICIDEQFSCKNICINSLD